MIGMSVNTFCERQASSKPRQLRADAGRSRARLIRPASSSATQASTSPRGDSADPRPAPGATVRWHGQWRHSAAVPASRRLADEPDRLGGFAEHHLEPGEHVAAVGGDDRDRDVRRTGTRRWPARGRGLIRRVDGQPVARATGPTRPRRRACSAVRMPVASSRSTKGVGRQQRVGGPAQLAVGAGQVAAQHARHPVPGGLRPGSMTPNRYRWPKAAALTRSSCSRAISAADWPTVSPVAWHSAAVAAAWLYSRSSSSATALVLAGRGRRRDAERGFRGRRERPADGDGAEALGALGEEDGLARCLAAQPPFHAAVLVPGEQVQVDDFLAAGHQPVVQALHAHLADRPERELEGLPADGVRGVRLVAAALRRLLAEPGKPGPPCGGSMSRLSGLPVAGPMPNCS